MGGLLSTGPTPSSLIACLQWQEQPEYMRIFNVTWWIQNGCVLHSSGVGYWEGSATNKATPSSSYYVW